MKITSFLIATACLGTIALIPATAYPQAPMDHSKMDHGQPAARADDARDLTDGEVRKIDKASGSLTIKHGDIKNLGMPAMTMAFQVKDKAMLDKLQAGDKIRFKAIDQGGKLVVTDLKPGR
jgi:Cu(I)/Ag(I) efflux system periplasmic protein CusF